MNRVIFQGNGMLRLAAVVISIVGMSALGAATAAPVSVGFDDIDTSGGDTVIVSPYQGLIFTNFLAYTFLTGFDGFNDGIVSPSNAAYSGGETGGPITPVVGSISAATQFDFVSGALGAGYYDNLSLNVQGLLSGSVLYSRTLTLNTTGAQGFTFNFTGIDTVLFTATATSASTDPFFCGSFNCTQFTLDDFIFVPSDVIVPPPPPPPPPPSGDVPEPATLALMTPLLFAGIFRRRKRTS